MDGKSFNDYMKHNDFSYSTYPELTPFELQKLNNDFENLMARKKLEREIKDKENKPCTK